MNILSEIQTKLKCAKSQYNKFGGYNYRSLEDIFEGLKPLLKEHNCGLIVSDEIVLIGNRYYIKATAQLVDDKKNIIAENTGYAREPEGRKGMDEAQVTGATSSYARKYALNGLFAIDDTKDADTDEHKTQTASGDFKPSKHFKTFLEMKNWALDFRKSIEAAKSIEELETIYKLDKNNVAKAGALDDIFKKMVKTAINTQINKLGEK